MKLYTYFRSTAAYRVRIALALKELSYDLIPVNLLSAEHKTDAFLTKNPEGLVPVLDNGEHVLTQSMAILEYLEEVHPEPALLPKNLVQKAYVRGLAQTIASDMHPLNNLRVLKFLTDDLNVSEEKKLQWYHHWIKTGFTGLEKRLSKSSGKYCVGDALSLADVCLVPQVYNAHRFNCPMDNYPNINRLNEHCMKLAAFSDTAPNLQPDAV